VRFIGSGRVVGLKDRELSKAQVVLLTVADRAIAPVARDLAALSDNWSGSVVLHTCGSLPARVLEPLRRRGASIGSLHPFQTVPDPAVGARNLRGCFWAVEGDPAARQLVALWVQTLKGVTLRIRPSRKPLYHLAAFLVCPTTVTLMEYSLGLLERSGVPSRVARPMLAQFVAETARNFAQLGGSRALTGPAARGDWPTLRQHVQTLRRHAPQALPVYRTLVGAMLRLAGRRAPRGLAL
jgi:predicted short-subunit dehydrogenase-like oxidoreductase (DUF2520 family)